MQDGKYLTFELADQVYAIEISRIKEILNGCGNITTVPEFPEYGRGVINLRGDIVPIIDMRRRFHMPEITMTDKICVIVTENLTESASEYLGFVVDKVQAVLDFEGKDISEAPKIASSTNDYILGVYKAANQITIILDPEALLTDKMIDAIGDYMKVSGNA